MNTTKQGQGGLRALRKYVAPQAPQERCELCRRVIAPDHQHLIEPTSRQLLCCCDACAILFSGHEQSRYRRVPRRVRVLTDFQLDDAQWESLGLPINLAFFFRSTPAERVVALYPGPAGATESLLALQAWQQLVDQNPRLAELEPDAEALLVNRIGSERRYFVVPIDICYALVGLIRTHWRGLSGGNAAWEAIRQFFAKLEARAYA